MISAEELVLEMDKEDSGCFKLATVMELFENGTAKIRFDGEDAASEKQYAYLDSYIPKEGDRVLLGILGGTYLILGRVNYNKSPSVEEEIDRYLFDLKKVIMEKGLSVSGDTNLDNVVIKNANVTEKITVNEATIEAAAIAILEVINTLYAGGVEATSLKANGEVNANAATIANTITANRFLNSANGSADFYNFRHRGNQISFFNGSYTNKKSVSTISTSATLSELITRFNQLVTAFIDYNLL